jgi:hypothetical protein
MCSGYGKCVPSSQCKFGEKIAVPVSGWSDCGGENLCCKNDGVINTPAPTAGNINQTSTPQTISTTCTMNMIDFSYHTDANDNNGGCYMYMVTNCPGIADGPICISKIQ